MGTDGHAINSSSKHVPHVLDGVQVWGTSWPMKASNIVGVRFVLNDLCSVTWRIIIHEKVSITKYPHLGDHLKPNDIIQVTFSIQSASPEQHKVGTSSSPDASPNHQAAAPIMVMFSNSTSCQLFPWLSPNLLMPIIEIQTESGLISKKNSFALI